MGGSPQSLWPTWAGPQPAAPGCQVAGLVPKKPGCSCLSQLPGDRRRESSGGRQPGSGWQPPLLEASLAPLSQLSLWTWQLSDLPGGALCLGSLLLAEPLQKPAGTRI